MDNTEEIERTITRMIENGITPMQEEDYEKALVITEELREMPFYQNTTSISLEDAIETSYEYMIQYPNLKDHILTVQEIPFFPFIKEGEIEEMYYQTWIDPESLEVKLLYIPKNLNKQSPVYLAHEIHHILKDTNKEEYKDKLKYADVIPLFFELLIGEENKEIVSNRLFMLNLYKDIIKDHLNRDNNPLQDLYDSSISQYYLSTYYAILLLEEYEKHPKKILEEISSVLRKESTTKELLTKNHIINSNNKELVREKMKIYTDKKSYPIG